METHCNPKEIHSQLHRAVLVTLEQKDQTQSRSDSSWCWGKSSGSTQDSPMSPLEPLSSERSNNSQERPGLSGMLRWWERTSLNKPRAWRQQMLYGTIKQWFTTWLDEGRHCAEGERRPECVVLVSALPDHPRETSHSHLTSHHEAVQHRDLSVRFGGLPIQMQKTWLPIQIH